MQIHIVLGSSVALQFTAAALAFRLIRYSERRFAWALIASAIILMATRRCVTWYRLLSQDVSKPPDLSAELVALVISTLMVVGFGFLQRAARLESDPLPYGEPSDALIHRLSRSAIAIAVLAAIGCGGVALYAYQSSRHAAVHDVSEWLLGDARRIAAFADGAAARSPTALVRSIEAIWGRYAQRRATATCVYAGARNRAGWLESGCHGRKSAGHTGRGR